MKGKENMNIAAFDVNKIKRRITCAKILQPYRINLNGKPTKCIICGAKKAFFVEKDTDEFTCSTCGATGDSIDLFAAIWKKKRSTAITDVAKICRIKKEFQKTDFILPGGSRSIDESAYDIGMIMADTQQYFNHNGMLARVKPTKTKKFDLSHIKDEAFASEMEIFSNVQKTNKDGNPVPATCIPSVAKSVIKSSTFLETLNPLNLITNCPIITVHNNKLREITGYDRDTGIYANGETPADILVSEATCVILDVLSDFKFSTPSDLSRAVTSIITPALVFGGFLGQERAPIDLSEADQSQTGKTFRNKITSAIYNNSVRTIAQQRGGVGSTEESFASAIVDGASFIAFDNIRGKFDSQIIEMFMTSNSFTARIPYRGHICMDVSKTVVMLTSNKADLTRDLANRCVSVKILRQADDYTFKQYKEGSILDHINANPHVYIGAIFAVIKEWASAGFPRTNESRHDFRTWAQITDWIIQNIFQLPPIMDGHRATLLRMSNPAMNWLRDLAMEIAAAGKLEEDMSTANILELISDTDTLYQIAPEDYDDTNEDHRRRVLMKIGRKMKACFSGVDPECIVDNFLISRTENYIPSLRRSTHLYSFRNLSADTSITAKSALDDQELMPF